jgi:hypothetical protein
VANEERSFSTVVERMLKEVDYLIQLCKQMTIYNGDTPRAERPNLQALSEPRDPCEPSRAGQVTENG